MSGSHKYDYNYGFDDGGQGPNSGGEGIGSWIPTIIFLFCFPPVGVVLLALKLMGLSGVSRRRYSRHPYDIQHAQDRPDLEERADVSRADRREAAKDKRKKRRDERRGSPASLSGKSFLIPGAILSAVFGLAAADEIFSALRFGTLLSSLPDIFTPLAFLGGGLFLLYLGVTKDKKARRYRNYLALIGKQESIALTTLAQATGLSIRRVREDLLDMLELGLLPTGYLDMSTGRLVLSEDGIHDPEPEPEAEQAPAGMEREEAVLTEIRTVNDAIADPTMSAKIDRVGEITGKIFTYLRENPDKEGQLRSFLSYYLPTTLKILRAYAQMEAQGVEGENIRSAKHRIEGMMDKVVDGFEKQLDLLFRDNAMDIASDVEVLERMLEKDGLGRQGLTLGGS